MHPVITWLLSLLHLRLQVKDIAWYKIILVKAQKLTCNFLCSSDYIDIEFEEEVVSRGKSREAGSVKVASITADGQLKETIYGQLDKRAKADVLTDLLVKGAVHYALEKQQVKCLTCVYIED